MFKFIKFIIIVKLLISLSLFIPSIVLGDYARDRSFSDRRDEIYRDKSIPYRERVSKSLDLHESMYGGSGSDSGGSNIVLIFLTIMGIGGYLAYKDKNKISDKEKNTSNNKTDLSKTEKQFTSIIEGIKNCPFCAEFVKFEAIYCKHCKKNISEDDIKNEVALSQSEVILSGAEIDGFKKIPFYTVNDGLKLARSKDYNNAIKAFSSIIENEKNNGDAYYYRAISYGFIGEKSLKESDLQMASTLGSAKATEYYKNKKGQQ